MVHNIHVELLNYILCTNVKGHSVDIHKGLACCCLGTAASLGEVAGPLRGDVQAARCRGTGRPPQKNGDRNLLIRAH